MNRLTRQEQLVLCSVLGLLLVGLAVKLYRQSQPRPATTSVASASATNAAGLK